MTIKDLARETGYSLGTVSRVLNGRPNVSPKAREAILTRAREAGFVRNANAMHLKQSRGEGILALVTGTSNELFARMTETAQRALAGTGYDLTIEYLEEDEDPVRYGIRAMGEKKPRGLLFLGGDPRLFRESFGGISLPSVVLTADASGLGFPNLSSVTTDDRAAAREAVDYLAARGHRQLGIIAGDPEHSGPSRLRLAGCREAFAARGLGDPEDCLETARFSFEGGYSACVRLLNRGRPCSAIFAMSDVMALGALRALADRGLRVPEDLSLMGFDGLEMGRYAIPRLTTVCQGAEPMALRGVELLLETLEGKRSTPCHETVPYALAEHASVENFRKD